MRGRRLGAALATTLVASLALVACAESERGNEGTPDTLIFGAAEDPKVLDPSLASDGETFRVTRQIYETLVQPELGGAEIVPGLAESWEPDETGTVWTFHLKRGVKFHDGTDFDAEAVCFNFDRWYNFRGLMQNPDISYYWQAVFGGFAQNEEEYADALGESLYKSCEAADPYTAVITTTRVTSAFPAALALAAFSIASPTALQQYDADGISGTVDNPTFPEYAMKHAVGTGPYKFVSWDTVTNTVTLERFEDYHGEKAKIKNLVFRAIGDLNARKLALRNGEIHGYDFVAPEDVAILRGEGFNVLTRPAFNILYLAINQSGNPALADIRVRQAIAHAINREAIVSSVYPEGSEVAKNFMPPSLPGYNANVTTYEYDVDKAKDLLAQAGYASGLTLKFYYPTNVSRPYMPDPAAIFELISADLQAAGITIEPAPLEWNPPYLNAVQNPGDHDLHLLGWTGDYADAYNFIGTFFARPTGEWGFDYPELFAAFVEADSEPDYDTRNGLYEDINAMIADFVPGVPIAHSPPSLVLASNVTGLAPSPLTDERFHTVEFVTP